jgi:hypothetical protein
MFAKGKNECSLEIAYHQTISRLFIFRFLWTVVAVWPLSILGIWFGILSFIHFWFMLILGERSKEIWTRQTRLLQYFTEWQLYFHFFTNRRPPFLPR